MYILGTRVFLYMVNFLQHHKLHLDMIDYRNFTRKPWYCLVIYERPDAGQSDLTVQVMAIWAVEFSNRGYKNRKVFA